MSVIEIQAAIKRLNREELAQLASWVEEERERRWDMQIAGDVREGSLNAFIDEARHQFEAGECRRVTVFGLDCRSEDESDLDRRRHVED